MNSFNSYLESLPSFIAQTDADWGMVYDWMEEMCGELTDTQWEEVAEVYKEFNNDSRFWIYLTVRLGSLYPGRLIRDSWEGGTQSVDLPPGSCIVIKSSGIDPMFDELWSEIQDAPGEIFDIPEMQELDEDKKFNVTEYLNSNYDYWWWINWKCWPLVNN